MDADEWEVLELAGAYLFDISLVPIAWYEAEPKPVQLARSDDHTVLDTWWKKHAPDIPAREYFDGCLTRDVESTQIEDLVETVWVDENHHRVELWESKAGDVAHLDLHIDARYAYMDFLGSVVEFATKEKCMFFFYSEEVFVEAASVTVFEALNRSPAAALARGEGSYSGTH